MKNNILSRIFAVLVPVLILVGIFYWIRGGDENTLVKKGSSCENMLLERMKTSGVSYDVLDEEVYTGQVAGVRFDGNFPEAKMFQTKIREAAQQGPNFAGHYTVATWGCGSGCQQHAVVDAQSGDIISFGITTEMGLRYYPNSRILITNPPENFPKISEVDMTKSEIEMTWSKLPREYYVLTENTDTSYLEKICTENPFEQGV